MAEIASDWQDLDSCIEIGGERIPVPFPVVHWSVSDLEFKPGQGARRRESLIDLLVYHWTGGENDVPLMFQTLQRRGLGIEFAIDLDGVCWQFCDPVEVDTFDAGSVNRRSIGVEIVNYGYRSFRSKVPTTTWGDRRKTHWEKIHGRPRKVADFLEAQVWTATELAWTLTQLKDTAVQIPGRIPTDAKGKILSRALTESELLSYSGVLGHYHLNKKKLDPGTRLMQTIGDNL